ncbi:MULTISPECIES: hypothetical protein [Pseudoalteromonas]|uniref:hypothetical protein n=1 Tax=Pseudoalteromonas TaxID=53246 RepID=UPI0002D8946A|nr:hypothetical protein [Pseudoalteromonas haloplanktis]MCF6145829.1 hypothetical protein [Pseudoalteromonas mariniglutinosa NCIMB 1770]
MTEQSMTEQKIIRVLKIFIALGITLILTGHYLLVSDIFAQQNSIHSIMIGAVFIAVGILCSLPTKIYLTIVLMKMEAEHDQHTQ